MCFEMSCVTANVLCFMFKLRIYKPNLQKRDLILLYTITLDSLHK